MWSWQLIGTKQIELQELPVPEPGPGQVLVKVMACSICSRTDLVYYTYCGIKPHCRPGHFGHEVSGVIEALGKSVSGLRIGQRVFLRGPGKPGGLSEYCLADVVSVGRLPNHMSFIEGAPAQQVPIAVNATRTLQPGNDIVIFGAGSAGLQILQVARLRGAAQVVTVDLYEPRLEIARSLGADVCLKADDVNVLSEIRRVLPAGPDIAYDAVGIPSVVQRCIDCVRNEGVVCIFGTHHIEERVALNLLQWEEKAITVHMANEGSTRTRREAMRMTERLLANRLIETRPYVTHVLPMEELPKAIELLSMSPLLYPEGDPQGLGMPAKEALKVTIAMHEGADQAPDGSIFKIGPPGEEVHNRRTSSHRRGNPLRRVPPLRARVGATSRRVADALLLWPRALWRKWQLVRRALQTGNPLKCSQLTALLLAPWSLWVSPLFLRALGVTIVRHSDRVLRISLPGGLVLFAPIVNLTHGELIGGVSPPHAESAFQQAMEMLFYVAYADQYDACRLIRDGDSVIDLGANVGVFTILASRLVGEGGLVVAVEPLAQNQECLELTCSQNNLSNVMIIRQAVGGHEGEVQLNLAPRIGAHSAVAIRSSVPSTVPMRTVDRLLADHGIEQAHFVKIDIEGMEAEALEGARATLRQHGPVLAVSSYHLPGDVERLSSIIEHIRGDYCIRHERFARDLDPVLLAQPDGGDSR